MEQVTLHLPADTLAAVACLSAGSGESRETAISRLIEEAVAAKEEAAAVAQFIRAYTEQPQTEEEVGLSHALIGDALAALPWDE